MNEKERATSYRIAELEKAVRWLVTLLVKGRNPEEAPELLKDIISPALEHSQNPSGRF